MFTRRMVLGALGAATLLGSGGIALAQDKPYIALVSKGFQHQFWQAVKAGADKAATDLGVTVTFEGPESEDPGRPPDRHAVRRARQEARRPSASPRSTARRRSRCCSRRRTPTFPVVAFNSGVDSDIPIATARPTTSPRRRSPPTRWRN